MLAVWARAGADGLLLRVRYVVEGRVRSGHGVPSERPGLHELGEGWGGARNVRLEGNPELARGVDVADWTGPQFDPAPDPDGRSPDLAHGTADGGSER